MTSLNPVTSVGRQLSDIVRLHLGLGPKAARDRAFELLDQVDIAQASRPFKAYPHELSGGQKQRVMIAMAIACEPELMITDEPTTALDVRTQRQVLDLLLDLQQRHHLTYLFISHDLSVIRMMADEIAVMQRGKIIERGRPAQIYQQPQHEYTQRLLAAVPRGHNGAGRKRP